MRCFGHRAGTALAVAALSPPLSAEARGEPRGADSAAIATAMQDDTARLADVGTAFVPFSDGRAR